MLCLNGKIVTKKLKKENSSSERSQSSPQFFSVVQFQEQKMHGILYLKNPTDFCSSDH